MKPPDGSPPQTYANYEINGHFNRWLRFKLVGAEETGAKITLTGLVMQKEFKHQAKAYATTQWKDILCQITIAYHFLIFYHLIIDAIIVGTAYCLIRLVPRDDLVLELEHALGTAVVGIALIGHLGHVLYSNMGD